MPWAWNRVTSSTTTPKVQDKGAPIVKPTSMGAKLKCLWSMGNKEKELQVCACLQGYDIIGITEIWWGDLRAGT